MEILPKVQAAPENASTNKNSDLEPSPLNPNPFPTIDVKNRENNLVEMELLRKRKNTGNLSEDEKVKLRRINNRIAAQNSRERSRIHALELKKQVKSLTDENIKLSEQCSRLLEINQSLIEENTALSKELDRIRSLDAANTESKINSDIQIRVNDSSSKVGDFNFQVPNISVSTTNIATNDSTTNIKSEIKTEIPDMLTIHDSMPPFHQLQIPIPSNQPNNIPYFLQGPNFENGPNFVIKEEPLNLTIWKPEEIIPNKHQDKPIFPFPPTNDQKYDLPQILQNDVTLTNEGLKQESTESSFDVIKRLIEGSKPNYEPTNVENGLNRPLNEITFNASQPQLIQDNTTSFASSWPQQPVVTPSLSIPQPDPDDFSRAVENWRKKNLDAQNQLNQWKSLENQLDMSLNKSNLRCSGGGVSQIKTEVLPQSDNNKIELFPLEFLSAASSDLWGKLTYVPDINNNTDINNNGNNNASKLTYVPDINNNTDINNNGNNNASNIQNGFYNLAMEGNGGVKQEAVEIKTENDTTINLNSIPVPHFSLNGNILGGTEAAPPAHDQTNKVSPLIKDSDRDIEAEIQRMLDISDSSSMNSITLPSVFSSVTESKT